ncbi:hypothetical protein GGI04_005604, partial [Coemansia thaxteri]
DIEYKFDGAACLTNICMFDMCIPGSFVFALDQSTKALNLVETLNSEKVHEVCSVLPPTSCRYFVFQRSFTRAMRHRVAVHVVAWLPQQAEVRERVLYKRQIKDLCAQLRRVDHKFEIYN